MILKSQWLKTSIYLQLFFLDLTLSTSCSTIPMKKKIKNLHLIFSISIQINNLISSSKNFIYLVLEFIENKLLPNTSAMPGSTSTLVFHNKLELDSYKPILKWENLDHTKKWSLQLPGNYNLSSDSVKPLPKWDYPTKWLWAMLMKP